MTQWQKNLYGCWLAQILSLTGFGFAFPFIPYFLQEMGLTDPVRLRLWVGITTSVPGLVMGLVAPLWGLLADKLGRKLMILRAMFAGSLFMGLMGLSPNPATLLVMRTFMGAFSGTVPASVTLVASATPQHRLSYALGFLASANYIGLSLGPLLGGLSAEFFGYRFSFLIGSLCILGGFLLVMAVVREERDDRTKGPRQTFSIPIKSFLRPPLLFIFVAIFLFRFTRTLPTSFIPLYIQELRGTLKGAAAVTGAISAAGGVLTAVSGLTVARLGDRINRVVLLAFLLASAALISSPIFFLPSLWGFTLFYLLTIFSLGAIDPILQTHLSLITPADKRGMIFGIHTLVASTGWFFSPITGSSISILFSIRHIFLLFSLALLANFFLVAVTMNRGEKSSAGSRPQDGSGSDS
jgi:DHA1 family multidrug resistance protein-like MFS transporter